MVLNLVDYPKCYKARNWSLFHSSLFLMGERN